MALQREDKYNGNNINLRLGLAAVFFEIATTCRSLYNSHMVGKFV